MVIYQLKREKLRRKYDGEFPDKYFNEIMRYLEIKRSDFFKTVDKFRSPHIWKS